MTDYEEEYQLEERYNAFLDECYGDSEGMIFVAGYRYSVSELLKNCDPIAYRCGLSDFEDMEERDKEEEEEEEEELELEDA